MTIADLAHYHAQERAPVCALYRHERVCSMGPPSSGGISVLQILSMLQRFAPASLAPNSQSEVHLFSQASRLAFADRAMYMGDPAFVSVPVRQLLDSHYLGARSALIDPSHDMGEAEPGVLPTLHYAPQKSHEVARHQPYVHCR